MGKRMDRHEKRARKEIQSGAKRKRREKITDAFMETEMRVNRSVFDDDLFAPQPARPMAKTEPGPVEETPDKSAEDIAETIETVLPEPVEIDNTEYEEAAEDEAEPTESEPEDEIEAESIADEVIQRLKGKIEATLFVTGHALSLERLSELVEAEADVVEMALGELIQDYAFRDGALEIDDTDGYILQVREEHGDIVNKMMPLELTAGVIRTLSAIAIKAPVLQSDLIDLRGSSAYEHIAELLSRKLITKRRKGRSYMINTTASFHEYFKLVGDKKELEQLVSELGREDAPNHTDENGADFDDAPDAEAV